MPEPDDDAPLSHQERVERFHEALINLVDYWVAEYEITMAELIGTLQTEMFNRQSAAWHEAQDDDA
jgi:hypothetical protein